MDVKTNRQQAELLWSQVTKAEGDPRLREHLANVMRIYQVPGRDPLALIRAVQRFCQDHIKYVREHPETYASPARTLAWGLGDCDDLTILICATLRGAKIPCRAVFAGWAKTGPIQFKHVYPEAFFGGRWIALESVRKVPLGWDCLVEKAKKGFQIRRATIGDRPEDLSS